jgi:hypothetical protein
VDIGRNFIERFFWARAMERSVKRTHINNHGGWRIKHSDHDLLRRWYTYLLSGKKNTQHFRCLRISAAMLQLSAYSHCVIFRLHSRPFRPGSLKMGQALSFTVIKLQG